MIVSLSELKEHLRVQHDEEDSFLEGLIRQAQEVAETYCRVSFEPYLDEDGNEIDSPEPVRLAILLHASFYYENRDLPDMTTFKAMRMAFESLLYPYRDPELLF